MSDLKNVLKAGFLLTASLLATGCGEGDNKGTTPTNPNPTNPTNPGDTDTPAPVASDVSSHTLSLGYIAENLGFIVVGLPAAPAGGYADNYDVLANLKVETEAKLALGTKEPYSTNTLIFSSVDQKGKAFLFDTGSFKALKDGEAHIGALLLEGTIGEKRIPFVGKVKGELGTHALTLRNGVLSGAEATGKLASTYTYVGVDAGIGYESAREDKDGKAIEIPLTIHAQPSVVAATSLSAGTGSKSKPLSQATASKAKAVAHVDAGDKTNQAKAVDKVATAPKAPANVLTLTTKKPLSDIKKNLDAADLNVDANQGSLDIAGRIHSVVLQDGFVTALSKEQPVLVAVADIKTTTATKPVADTAADDADAKAVKAEADKKAADLKKKLADEQATAKTLKTTADTKSKAQTAAKERADKAAKVISDLKKDTKATTDQTKADNDAKAALKKATEANEAAQDALKAQKAKVTAAQKAVAALAAPAVKKSKATSTTVAADSAATAGKTSVSQSIVKATDGAHKFLFKVQEGGYYSEIGDLTVGTNASWHVISDHALFVHNLKLENDLKVDVLAQQHTFDKLEETDLSRFDATGATAADRATKGQAMMDILSKEQHSVQTSKVAEINDKTVEYVHYDSPTKFPLWVAASTVTTGKKFVLNSINLDTGIVLGAGVYALPLVKDMSGKLPNSFGNTAITLANGAKVAEWKIMGNGYFDQVLLIKVDAAAAAASLSSGAISAKLLMASDAQGGRSALTSVLNGLVSKLDPSNLVSGSFANLSASRATQAAQIAALARGVSAASAEKLGAVESYSVTFNHAGTQFGLTYNLEGGNAFTGGKGTTSFGANVATNVLGVKAIATAEASVDSGKNAYASSSVSSYNAGLTFAKAYSLGGLSVVPMGGFGVSSNALNSYSAVVPMAAGVLGLSMDDVSFNAATFHAGVNLSLDDVVAKAAGANASLTLGVAGYLASTANATLSTSEGKSADLQFDGSAVTPYAQFNLGFASGEKLNTMISSGIVAVNFGFDR